MHLTKLFAGFAPSARAYGSASRLRAKQGSYGTALVAEPINRHVEETLDSTISYLSSLYDSDETLGAIDSTNVKLPRLGRARTLEVDGRPIRSALRPATASVKDAINAPIWRPEMNTDGAGRIGATDFCLLMILQAYEAREPSSQWWQRIVALAEEAGRKRPDQGGTHMLERHSLRGAVKFF